MQPLSPIHLKKGQSFDNGYGGKEVPAPHAILATTATTSTAPQAKEEGEEEDEGYYDTEDTTICQTSHVAAMQAASVVCRGVDVVMESGNVSSIFF